MEAGSLLKSMKKIELEKQVVLASLQARLSIETAVRACWPVYSQLCHAALSKATNWLNQISILHPNIFLAGRLPFIDSKFLTQINEILEAARTCETDCDSEAGWNEEVHSIASHTVGTIYGNTGLEWLLFYRSSNRSKELWIALQFGFDNVYCYILLAAFYMDYIPART